MPPQLCHRPSRPLASLLGIVVALQALTGCQWSQKYYESLKGDGFQEWNQTMTPGSRGKTDDAKPSGFFTDRRSEQIEKNLGGGF